MKDPQLEAVANSEAQWSATATALKATYEAARNAVFMLSTTAAFVAAISSQQPNGRLRTGLAVVSTLCLTVATFLTARFLDAKHGKAWTRARSVAEALKREAFKNAAQAAPYDTSATSGSLLLAEAQKIEADVADLLDQRAASGKVSAPEDFFKLPADYLKDRVKDQIDWYERKATGYQASAKKLRSMEFVLALATTIITALVGILDKHVVANFDFVALTAVLTTLSGAIIAYVEASRYDYLVTSYRATSRRLSDQYAKPPSNPQAPSQSWSDFVIQCEAILQEETGAWMAKFSK